MIFNRRLRNLYVWVLLVGTYIVLLRVFDSAFNSNGWLDIIAWCAWFSLLGYQLGQMGISTAPGPSHGPGLAALRLALTAFLLVGIIGSFSVVTLLIVFKSVRPPWWWWTDQAGVAMVMALTMAFGLRTYAVLSIRQTLLAGAMTFIAVFAPGAALLMALQSHNVPFIEANHWAGVTLFAPSTLAALALFASAFRRISAWLGFAVLFAAPYAVFVWLVDTGRIVIVAAVRDFVILMIATLWVAAIGYWLQRASLAERASSGDNAQRSQTSPAPGMVASAAA